MFSSNEILDNLVKEYNYVTGNKEYKNKTNALKSSSYFTVFWFLLYNTYYIRFNFLYPESILSQNFYI